MILSRYIMKNIMRYFSWWWMEVVYLSCDIPYDSDIQIPLWWIYGIFTLWYSMKLWVIDGWLMHYQCIEKIGGCTLLSCKFLTIFIVKLLYIRYHYSIGGCINTIIHPFSKFFRVCYWKWPLSSLICPYLSVKNGDDPWKMGMKDGGLPA